jgi:PAS domain S-box-containing protein
MADAPRLLLLADADAPQLDLALQGAGVAPAAVAASAGPFAEALAAGPWDVVVASSTAMPLEEALAVVRGAHPELPVVAVARGDEDAEALVAVGASAVVVGADVRQAGGAVARALRATRGASPPDAERTGNADGATLEAPALLSPSTDAVRALAEHLPIGLYQSTPDGRVLFANEALAHVLGYPSCEALAHLDLRSDFGYPREHFEEQMGRFGAVRDLVVRWTDRTGRTKYTRENARTVRGADGRVLYYEGTMEDVTAEHERAAETARVLCQQKALVVLSALHAAGPEGVIRQATELAAECAEVARASVWVEDAGHGAMRCADLYDGGAGAHGEEAPLPLGAVEAVLAELGANRVVAVEDAEDDALLGRSGGAEALAAYLRARGVRALLVAPIRRGGRVAGVVVLAHVGGPRAWGAAERDFAAAVADLIALAFERTERQAAEAARRESEARYRAISELASDYAFATRSYAGGTARLAWATDAFARVTGYDPSEVPSLEAFLAIVHPETRPAACDALGRLGEGHDADLELRVVTKSGEDRWVRHRARRLSADEGGGVVLYHSGQDVTERKAFERALIAAREAAEEVARLKSVFLANMSHEIRTPLTAILGYSGLLAEEVEGEHREFASFIEKSGRRLLETLNSVLELARLEASGIEPSFERLDVTAEVHQAVRLLTPLAEEKGLALSVEVPEAEAAACLDRVCLGRIVTNLIGNAIKFTDEGGVHVAVEADEGAVRVRVRDTGCGIAEAFLPHLFSEFKQESEGIARSHEGAGLGLAITKRLTDLLGGTIAVESRRPGGSLFTVTFPRPVEASPAGVAGPSEDGEGTPLAWTLGRAADAGEQAEPDEATRVRPYVRHELLAFSEAPDGTEAEPASANAAAELPVFSDYAFVEEIVAREGERAEPAGGSEPASEAAGATADADGGETVLNEGGVQADSPGATPPAPGGGPAPPGTAPQPDAPMSDVPPSPDPAPSAPERPAEPAALPDPVMIAVPSASDAEPEQAEPAAEGPEAAPPEAPAVLVVEDNEDTRMLLERILRRSYRVVAVGDALTALDRMNRQRFDALVLDINLGGRQTGVDVLRVARAIPGYAGVFAVALTAYALPGDRERFLEAGFNRYVSKPFTRATLMAALEAGVPVEA